MGLNEAITRSRVSVAKAKPLPLKEVLAGIMGLRGRKQFFAYTLLFTLLGFLSNISSIYFLNLLVITSLL